MPIEQRYTRVVVAMDVNLNDKYGRMYVYPVTKDIKEDCSSKTKLQRIFLK